MHNGEWRTGMGSSLRAGPRALAGPDDGPVLTPDAGPEVGAAVVALADQPLVGAAAVARLIAAYRDGASVAVATYDGQPRNPVLLAREHWPEVIAPGRRRPWAPGRSCAPARISSRSSSAGTPAAPTTSTPPPTWPASPAPRPSPG